MRIRIDPDRCEGHGRCWEVAPELVEADDRGHGFVRDPAAGVPAHLQDAAIRAAKACPERAVTVISEQEGPPQ